MAFSAASLCFCFTLNSLIIVSSPVPPTPALHHHHPQTPSIKTSPSTILQQEKTIWTCTPKAHTLQQNLGPHSRCKIHHNLLSIQTPVTTTLPDTAPWQERELMGTKTHTKQNTPHLAHSIPLLVLLKRLQEHLSQKAMQNLEEKKGIEGLKRLKVVEKWGRRRRETKERQKRGRGREREREKGSREQEKRPEAQTCTLGLCVAMAGRQKREREREREGGREREPWLGRIGSVPSWAKALFIHGGGEELFSSIFFYFFWFAFAGSWGKWICKMILIPGPTKDRIEMATNREDPP